MRVLGYAIVAAALVIAASAEPAEAYDVAPGCTTEQFVEFFEAGHSPEDIVEMCEKIGSCSGLECYKKIEDKFINGRPVAQEPPQPDHTAETCADRCNEQPLCLSFELYDDDLCSLNAINSKKDPSVLSDSEHYVYYEHISRVAKE